MISRKSYQFGNDKLALVSRTCPVEFKAPKLIRGNMMWTLMSDQSSCLKIAYDFTF